MDFEILKKQIDELERKIEIGETVQINLKDENHVGESRAVSLRVNKNEATEIPHQILSADSMDKGIFRSGGKNLEIFNLDLNSVEISDREIEKIIENASNRAEKEIKDSLVNSRFRSLTNNLPPVVITLNPQKKLWEIHEECRYKPDNEAHTLIATKGFETDLASIPRIFWAIIASFELSLAAPVFHDLIYRYAGDLPEGKIEPFPRKIYERAEADKIFLELMTKANVARWKRQVAYYAVYYGAWWAWKRRDVPSRNSLDSQFDIFLSVAQEEYSAAIEITEKLRAENIAVYLNSPGDFDRSDGFADAAVKIQKSNKVALLFSDAALRSRTVKQTLQLAWKYGKSCLPVQIAPVSYSEQLELWLEDGQKPIQTFNAPAEIWLPQIVAALKPPSYSAFRGLGATASTVAHPVKSKARDLSELRQAASFTDRIWAVPANTVEVRQPTAVLRGLGAEQPDAIHNLRAGDAVCLVLELERDGYLLLLNEGAEKTVYCLCPSLFAPNRKLTSGRHFFPQPDSPFDSFVITGKGGREHLLAIITDEPLELGWMTHDRSEPARILSEDDKKNLISSLRNLDVRSWTAVATYFDVSNHG